jgi:hypothetical protein
MKMTTWLKIEYDLDAAGSILFSEGAPFDGKAVLIKTTTGVVEAWWYGGGWSEATPDHPAEYDGWYWVCYDDQFRAELDDAKAWMPIPA